MKKANFILGVVVASTGLFSSVSFAAKASVCTAEVTAFAKSENRTSNVEVTLVQMFNTAAGVTSEVYEVVDLDAQDPVLHQGRISPVYDRYFVNAIYKTDEPAKCEMQSFKVSK